MEGIRVAARRRTTYDKTIVLLIISNVFMNLAWYGHLKFKSWPLWLAILASWGVALFEYIFQVRANRVGSNEWPVPQKILQECITLAVFIVIAFALFRSPLVELLRGLRANRGRGVFRL